MPTIQAIFEDGVFKPLRPVALPERSAVEFEPRVVERVGVAEIAAMAESDAGLAAVYEVLSRRFRSGANELAERHNEHQR